ncbi:MAG: hypothetical protein EAS48_01100 [Chryseobacterium sp.]|nr:MAG: hypothetical protein EAS48_01100 [Chryseobacterium sp.]
MRRIFLFITFILQIAVGAQTLSTQLSDQTLALGEVGELRISISNVGGKGVNAAPRNELLPFHFEIVSDSVQLTPNLYTRNIKFQIFEEGTFNIPELEFKVGGRLVKSVPYTITVINTAKKGDEINDIMNNRSVSLGLAEYWQLYKGYILAALALIALIIAILYLRKYGRVRKDSPKTMTNETLRDLDKLRKKNYINNGEVRSFYVELIDISRRFLAQRYGFPARELLTDDLIDYMHKQDKISEENERLIADVFIRGDLAKFAKAAPEKIQMESDLKEIRDFVKRAYKDIELENLRKDV